MTNLHERMLLDPRIEPANRTASACQVDVHPVELPGPLSSDTDSPYNYVPHKPQNNLCDFVTVSPPLSPSQSSDIYDRNTLERDLKLLN